MHRRSRFAHARPLRRVWLAIAGFVLAAGILAVAMVSTDSGDSTAQYCKYGLSETGGYVWYCSVSPISTLSPAQK